LGNHIISNKISSKKLPRRRRESTSKKEFKYTGSSFRSAIAVFDHERKKDDRKGGAKPSKTTCRGDSSGGSSSVRD